MIAKAVGRAEPANINVDSTKHPPKRTFNEENNQDVARVKASLSYLLFGPGDFIQRLHDLLYEPDKKLRRFGLFCALELYGTVKPAECPPMNGRLAKALRYLGYDVKVG